MIIEIIDPKPDPSVSIVKTCKNCGAKLRFYRIDIKDRIVRTFDDLYTVYFIKRPKCNEEITLRSKNG